MVYKIHKYADGGKIVKDHTPPAPRRTIGSPGLRGAIKDLISGVSMAVAPESVKSRKARIDQAVDDAS